MAMTSRERIAAAIHFTGPDRLPTSADRFGVSAKLNHAGHHKDGVETYAGSQGIDDFGCVWQRTEVRNMGYVTTHPLADLSRLPDYVWPDPDDPKKYEGLAEQVDQAGDRYAIVGLGITLWERLWMLHGMDQTLVELVTDPAPLAELADRIVDYDVRVIRNMGQACPGRIHGVQLTDDWGTQQATFISPKLWQRFFQPRYERIFCAAHEQGWDVWIHSDGRINEIIDGWIEAGLDVINLPAPLMVGIDEIGRRFRGRICFTGGVDNQMTLPQGDPQAIRAQAKLLLERWATPKGGFIGPDDDWIEGRDGSFLEQYGLTRQAVVTMVEAFREFDPYRAA